MAASLVGTALGVAVSYAVGTDPLSILGVFSLLSAVHLSSTYVSLCRVPLNTVNEQRGERIMTAFVRQGRVPTTEAVREEESFLRPHRSALNRIARLNTEARLTDILDDFERMVPSASAPPSYSPPAASWPLDRLLAFFHDQSFVLTVRSLSAAGAALSSPPYLISLAFLSTARSADVLTAHLLQVHYRLAIAELLPQSSSRRCP